MRLLVLGAVPMSVLGMLLGSALFLGGTTSAQAGTVCVAEPESGASSYPFDKEQLANAALIIKIGQARRVPPRGWVVALAAAMQESKLRNLSYGDRDSAGLFQMRPSLGWGSLADVTDPRYATTAFFGGKDVPPANVGLLDVARWQAMSVTEAAQAVERSGFPGAYAQWEDEAARLVHQLAGAAASCPSGGTTTCQPTGRPVEVGLTPDAVAVVRCAVQNFRIGSIGGLAQSGHIRGSDHYTGRAVDLMIRSWSTAGGASLGDRVAAYFIGHAREFGVTYVIWRARIWTVERPYWRPYSHPSGGTSPTLLHLDHVHVSVSGHTNPQ